MAGSSFEHTTPEPTRRYEAPKPPEAGSRVELRGYHHDRQEDR
jgi:hypothetical protein